MTIKVYKDRIEFDDYVLRATPTGFSFNGEIQAKLFESVFQGTVAGFSAGGYAPPTTNSNVIDKHSFTVDGNATDVGDLTVGRYSAAGASSPSHGYTAGGSIFTGSVSPQNVIDKFLFVSNGNATDVGDLTQGRSSSGQSSRVSGYASTGYGGSPVASVNTIDKFPFAADFNATDVGDSLAAKRYVASQSSQDFGYNTGGYDSAALNVIEKFSFSIDQNASDVADLTVARWIVAGQSSTVSGYTSGGLATPGSPTYNIIDKFPFATDANATDVGDLFSARGYVGGTSSTTSGYTADSTRIDKFPFSTDSNATNVGSLSSSRSYLPPVGQQY